LQCFRFRHLLTIDELSGIIPPIVTGSQAGDLDFGVRTSRSSSLSEHQGPDSINLNAGVPVLIHFEKKWQQIHNQGTLNLKLLAEAEAYAVEIADYCRRRQKVLDSFLHVYNHIDELDDAGAEIEQDLKRLFEQIKITENLVQSQRKANHEQSLVRLSEDRELWLGEQTERLQRQFEEFRKIMEAEHQDKAREHEKRLLARNQQQREQFRAEFEADLAEYKRTGKLRSRASDQRQQSTYQLTNSTSPEPEFIKDMVRSSKIADLKDEIDLNDSAEESGRKSTLEHIEVEPDESDQRALIEFLA
jgi:hypothetical protein